MNSAALCSAGSGTAQKEEDDGSVIVLPVHASGLSSVIVRTCESEGERTAASGMEDVRPGPKTSPGSRAAEIKAPVCMDVAPTKIFGREEEKRKERKKAKTQ